MNIPEFKIEEILKQANQAHFRFTPRWQFPSEVEFISGDLGFALTADTELDNGQTDSVLTVVRIRTLQEGLTEDEESMLDDAFYRVLSQLPNFVVVALSPPGMERIVAQSLVNRHGDAYFHSLPEATYVVTFRILDVPKPA
jgi:hypothetical protein